MAGKQEATNSPDLSPEQKHYYGTVGAPCAGAVLYLLAPSGGHIGDMAEGHGLALQLSSTTQVLPLYSTRPWTACHP